MQLFMLYKATQTVIEKNSKYMLSTYNQDPSSPAIALNHLTSLLSTQLFPTD